MSNESTLQLLTDIQDRLIAVKAYIESSHFTNSQAQNIMTELERVEVLASKPVEAWKKQVKANLETRGNYDEFGYSYSYKIGNRSIFDTDKAKSTLKSLDYNVDDFIKSTQSKTLQIQKLL
jgi:hypothetical protein